MTKQAIITVSEQGTALAEILSQELGNTAVFRWNGIDPEALFAQHDALVFIGSLGICVRTIAPYIRDKHIDPAVVCIDSAGMHVIPVLSGHVGGANELARRIARIIGAEAIITTQSDLNGLWALDLLGQQYGWKTVAGENGMNPAISAFVNGRPTALLLDIKDAGTEYLERTKPAHVDLYYRYENIPWERYELFLAVTPYVYPEKAIPVIYYRPSILHLGIGCRKDCMPAGIPEFITDNLKQNGISPDSIQTVSTIELKQYEPLIREISRAFGDIPARIYTAEELQGIEVDHPSEKVREVTSLPGVAEPSAIRSAGYGPLVLSKQKGALSEGNDFTFAVAIDRTAIRKGHIEIVGAGPGDPDLVSVKGRAFLEQADLILYAGSLVPIELTHCAKNGATVRSSASMNLEEQFELMKSFYDRGNLVVRLHTGDPCIYGAIQEQMAFFDRYDMDYHITPGISSFQAAAAALRSQFTIPEEVQTIILTRGEGETPMPEREKLSLLAQSQSTMCIFLSASIAEKVQAELLEHYPPETPVAACYKLTWKDERIYRGELKDLARIIRENNLTLTTMIVVGKAIDNRQGLSRLYADEFKHLYRP